MGRRQRQETEVAEEHALGPTSLARRRRGRRAVPQPSLARLGTMEDEPWRMGHARTSREGVSYKFCLADSSGHQLRDGQEIAVSTQGAAQPSITARGWKWQAMVDTAISQHSLRAHDGTDEITVDAEPT